MNEATKYLQPYKDYFWHYEDGGKVIAVPEGRTLGYTDHILMNIVPYLAADGLPGFGTLLLAIAATNAHGVGTLDDILERIGTRAARTSEVQKGMWFAKLLTRVPARYKKGDLRVQLIQAIFSNSHNSVNTVKSRRIIRELESTSITNYLAVQQAAILSEFTMTALAARDFKPLAILGKKFSSVEAILKLVAGIPPLGQELEIEREPKDRTEQGSLMDELVKNEATFHMGALVSHLIVGLHISFHASLPSEQPLGGVADITNRGKFDRLLSSEFAFDDEVLLSRLSNNEALYHHREAPPAHGDYPRVLFVDATLKNWGTIRTCSLAVALAIANHPKNNHPCRVYLVGASYHKMALATIDDVIDGLNVLDGSLDPGPGLQQFFSKEDLAGSEFFYIGAAASLDRPAMQRFMADYGKRIDHWIHPDEQGNIQLYKNPRRGKRFVQELNLPLNELWAKQGRAREDAATSNGTDYPILFPEVKMKTTWRDGHLVYGVTKHKALMRVYAERNRASTGWEFVVGNFPTRDNLKAVITHDDRSVTVLVASDAGEFALLAISSGERTPVPPNRRLRAGATFYVDEASFKTNIGNVTVSIDLQGRIAEHKYTGKFKVNDQFFKNRVANVYRNIRRVCVTQDNRLRFGKQDLLLEQTGLRLQCLTNRAGVKLEAHEDKPGVFTFPDGSSILHNPNGMLTLISADNALAAIHIPTKLNTVLGVATVDSFTGSTYYQIRHHAVQSKLTPPEFYTTYIQAFIDHIIHHGTSATEPR